MPYQPSWKERVPARSGYAFGRLSVLRYLCHRLRHAFLTGRFDPDTLCHCGVMSCVIRLRLPPVMLATRKQNVRRVLRPNVGVNWRSLPSVKRRRALGHPRPLRRRQPGRPLRPRPQVRALLERHARLCEAAARTGRQLRGAACVHAQGRFFSARLLLLVERHQTYVGRVLTGVTAALSIPSRHRAPLAAYRSPVSDQRAASRRSCIGIGAVSLTAFPLRRIAQSPARLNGDRANRFHACRFEGASPLFLRCIFSRL